MTKRSLLEQEGRGSDEENVISNSRIDDDNENDDDDDNAALKLCVEKVRLGIANFDVKFDKSRRNRLLLIWFLHGIECVLNPVSVVLGHLILYAEYSIWSIPPAPELF